jgi:hypothetical protein
MRRCIVLATLALATLAACGGGGGSKTSVTLGAATGGTSATARSGSGKFCTDAATNNLAQQLQTNAAANPATSSAALQKEVDLLKQYESEAPSAIRGDVTTLVNFYVKWAQAYTKDQGNVTKLASDLQGLQGDQASLQTAVQHVEAYYAANCHA